MSAQVVGTFRKTMNGTARGLKLAFHLYSFVDFGLDGGNSLRRGLLGVGVFFVFGTLASFYAGMTLVFPGTSLDRLWVLNPRAHHELSAFGRWTGISFFLLACALALTTLGWFKRRLWGWRLAVVIVASQVLGGLVHIFFGRVAQGVVGLTISGALLFYFLGAKVRAEFARP
jgi:hypothetical protein